jgi:hypothetical protein
MPESGIFKRFWIPASPRIGYKEFLSLEGE